MIELANTILRLSGLALKATPEQTDNGIKVQVRGDDVPLLLGHNAELLDALEYLCNRAQTHADGDESRIVFDSGNYRARREKELHLMAEKAAEKVRATRMPFSFDPMNPNERRIIHLALAHDSTVRTESRGEGENRKLIIYPA
jgi:spoIIIJ-associated protein